MRSTIRLSAVEAWRSAADRAEEFATLHERIDAEISPAEALRRIATLFRLIADDLDTLPSPSSVLQEQLSKTAGEE